MITQESRFRDLGRAIIWFPFRWSLFALPRIEWGFPLFRAMGSLHHHLAKGKAELIKKAFRRAGLQLSEVQLEIEAKHFLQNHYESSLLVMLSPRLHASTLDRCHSFQGFPLLEEALRKGKGVVIIHPHMGPVQLPMVHLATMGYPVIQVGALAVPKGLSRMGHRILELRRGYENRLPARILSPTSFLRPLFDTLSRNGIVFIPGDGSGFGRSYGRFVQVPFLDRTVPFPTGAASLAHKTGAELIPLFTKRDGRKYLSILDDPLSQASGTARNHQETAERFGRWFEAHLRQNPGLWLLWDEFPFENHVQRQESP